MTTVLDSMISMERYELMLKLLSPRQLLVVALRHDGMSSSQIARELGITRSAVYQRLERAGETIAQAFPEFQRTIQGRSRRWGACYETRYAGERLTPAMCAVYDALAEIDAAGNPAYPAAIAQAIDKPHHHVCHQLRLLLDNGLVEKGERQGRRQLYHPVSSPVSPGN